MAGRGSPTQTDHLSRGLGGEDDRAGWVQQMESSDYRSPSPTDTALPSPAAAPFEQIDLDAPRGQPPPAPAPLPPAAGPEKKARRQKAAAVGFSSTVRVLRQAPSDSSLHNHRLHGAGGLDHPTHPRTNASAGDDNGVGGGSEGAHASRRPFADREQTAQLWQAGPSPTDGAFPRDPLFAPNGGGGGDRRPPAAPAFSVDSGDPAGEDQRHPYGYPRPTPTTGEQQATYGGPSSLSGNGYDSDASSIEGDSTTYHPSTIGGPRPFYARSESEASSTLSFDEPGDDEDVLYDWSGEEDLVDQEAKVKEKLGLSQKRTKRWGPIRCVRVSFSLSLLLLRLLRKERGR